MAPTWHRPSFRGENGAVAKPFAALPDIAATFERAWAASSGRICPGRSKNRSR